MTELRRVILGAVVMALSLTLPHVWMQVSQFLLGALLTGLGVHDWVIKQNRAIREEEVHNAYLSGLAKRAEEEHGK